MHVLILNQTFHPDVAATGQLMWDLAQHLDARGHRVSVVTSLAFYGTDRQYTVPHEKIGNIEIHRMRGTAFGKRTHFGRLMDFGSYYAAAGWQLVKLPKPDVILALTSPPMVATLAMLQKQFCRTACGKPVRFVYHIMDLYPDAAVASGMINANFRTDRAMRRLTARTLDLADAVIALGRDMKDRLIRQYGRHANPSRIRVVPPWSDGAALFPLDKKENPLAASLGLAESFNIVYSGNLGIAHDLDTMLAAMQAMRDDAGVNWLFIGAGKRFEPLRRHVQQAGWKHVRLLPFQDRAGLNQSLNLADVHLVSQLPAFTGVVVPSKLFGILAVGKPAVMVGPPDAECSRIIDESGAGFVIANGDSTNLVEKLRALQRDDNLRREIGRRGRRAFEIAYDRPVACRRIEEILKEVVET